jgi:hypothetical protein
VGGSAWLLYYSPKRAYRKAIKARAARPAAVEEMVAEALRRLFLKPGADYYRSLIELLGNDRLALMLKKKTKLFYVFRLYRLEDGDMLKGLNIKLKITKIKKLKA